MKVSKPGQGVERDDKVGVSGSHVAGVLALGGHSLVRMRDDGGLEEGEADKSDSLTRRFEDRRRRRMPLAHGERGGGLGCRHHEARVLRLG